MKRRRSVPHTFEDQIAAEKAKTEGQVAKLRPGPAKDALLKKIGQLDTAAHINEWLTSPGLRTPEWSRGKKHPPSDDEPKDEPSRTEQAWQVAEEYASDQREILKKLRKPSNR